LKLRSRVPKLLGVGRHREVSAEDTLDRMQPHLLRMGVTRVADITGLDRIGIPVHNAIVPRSNDILSVYNGKGTTAAESRAGAVMEAAERYAAALPRPPAEVGSFRELSRRRRVLDPGDVNLERYRDYTDDTPISWHEGFDLLHDETILVPAFLAAYHPLQVTELPPVAITTTNGLASGNSLEEAICHALCELIERDDWTMADLVGHRFSRALQMGTLEGGRPDPAAAEWFHERYPNLDLATLPEDGQRLVAHYEDAGLKLEIKSITSGFGIPTFIGIVAEYVSDSFSQSHFGLGTHPDANVAVVRCMTEVAQARVVDIHAMREDISMPDQTVDRAMLHVKRKAKINPAAWYFKESRRLVPLAESPSHPSDDVMTDVRLMLDRLAADGLDRVIAVDVSPPEVPATVVRVIVPGAESYAVDRSRIGPRAAATWNTALATLKATREAAALARPAAGSS
jgi:ribosomal protein S12 methylthiotransferase accessory factor